MTLDLSKLNSHSADFETLLKQYQEIDSYLADTIEGEREYYKRMYEETRAFNTNESPEQTFDTMVGRLESRYQSIAA